MIKETYEFLLMLDQTGAAYLIFLLGFLLMADYCFTSQAEVIRLRKILKQAMR
jgi:hypothetical protein